MTFLAPWYGILVVVVLLPWILRGEEGKRDWIQATLRSIVLLLLVLALARPAWLHRDPDLAYQVFVHEEGRPAVENWLSNQREQAEAKGERVIQVEIEDAGISEALETAASSIPLGGRGAITVLSTGETRDWQWGNAIRQLQERSLPVHAVSLPAEEVASLRLLGLESPQTMRVGQEATVIAEVINVGAGQEFQLVDEGDGNLLGSVQQEAAAERAYMKFTVEPPRSGFLRLVLRAGDVALRRTFAVEDPLRVLYLGERWIQGGNRMQDLLGHSAEVIGERTLPADLGGHDVVMLDDFPSANLPEADQERLVEQIRQGGLGLLMSGGTASFGAGGYADTPLAEALPIELMQKEEKRDPSTTLAVIIDTSGSMGGERVQLAKEVARLAIRRLLPHDKVGIVEFYGTKQWAAPIQSAANAIDIQRALNRLDAGGGTVIMPAIEEAYYALQNVETRYKHVLVLTDGGVEAGEFEPLMRKMANKGINVSTVLVGGDAHSEFLVNLANWGKGHFYSASNRFSIPEILLKQPSTSKIPSYRPGQHEVQGRGGSGWWGEIDRASVPLLNGYVETRKRDGAEVLLETEVNRHPLLATWRLGLGRVTTFHSEPVGSGTRSWAAWEDYGTWLARVLSRTAREERHPFAYSAERRGHRVHVRADKLVDGEVLPWLERESNDPSGDDAMPAERVPVPLERQSPRVFTASLKLSPESEARFWAGTASGDTGTDTERRAPVPLVSNALDDVTLALSRDPDERLDLSHLASATDGSWLPFSEAKDFRPVPGGGVDSLVLRRLWNLCLLLALLCYLAELAYRRWPYRTQS